MAYKIGKIDNYAGKKGWICGQFFPGGTIEHNTQVEVKYCTLRPGDSEPEHYHPQGMELVIIIKGKAKWILDGKEFLVKDGDVIFLEKNVHETIPEVLEPITIVSIRTPSLPGNKIKV